MKSDATVKHRHKTPPLMPDKALKVLAHSIYQTLRQEGCQEKDILGVSSQLIGLVTSALAAGEGKTVATQVVDAVKKSPGRF